MKKKIILIVVVVLLVAIQFVRIDQTNPVSNPQAEFAVVASVPDNVQMILKESCYDCHSNHTFYPWYANVAPVSWFLQHDINEGREHLNFSDWGHYSADDRHDLLKECLKEVNEGEMPLKPYVLLHPNAKLTADEKETLKQWFSANSAISVLAARN
ncbi:MAG TPA: heme-binding domain-containing protein [Lentimicrobium sp.]|nr:heme-binding domain-containing protein [Lentimicrobium sp.]